MIRLLRSLRADRRSGHPCRKMTAIPLQSSPGSLSSAQRHLLTITAAGLAAFQLFRIYQIGASYQDGYTFPDIATVIGIVLGLLFAVQLARRRWLVPACCFFLAAIAVNVWAALQMPLEIEGEPFRQQVLMMRLPTLTVSLVCFALVLYVICASSRRRI